ncbi:MAG: hypothetical protein ABWY45_16285 [Mycobacterium sp.]
MDNTVWIVVAVIVVLLVLAALVFAGRSRRNKQLHTKAELIREEVEQDAVQVKRREALAEETAAKARAAQAEAEAKAAEAARLAQRADVHRDAVSTSREDLDERRAHADSIDPRVKSSHAADDNDTTVVEQGTVPPQGTQPPAAHAR